MPQNIAIVGGGAAGFFAAIECAQKYHQNNIKAQVTIYEQSKDVLHKVRVSGGGRCNVTHACWTPKELVKFYPRGSQELIGPFHTFCCGDTVAWFEAQGVELKIEPDGRMFPQSNTSQTIVDCLLQTAQKWGVKVQTQHKMTLLQPLENGKWLLGINKEKEFTVDKIMIATGSSKSIWEKLEQLGLSIVPPVASLFTFNIKNELLHDLMGIALQNVHIKIVGTSLEASGPLLITHWGLSGPAILRLSAWGARILHQKNYDFQIQVNFTGFEKQQDVLKHLKQVQNKQRIYNTPQYNIPKRLWWQILQIAQIEEEKTWNEFGKKQANVLANLLTQAVLEVKGKSTFKDEFVTAGGVELSQINFKRFESKQLPNLFFAGEVLDIDAITGGFNFQAAWTGGFIAGNAMAEI